jgi:hypothetical protein
VLVTPFVESIRSDPDVVAVFEVMTLVVATTPFTILVNVLPVTD